MQLYLVAQSSETTLDKGSLKEIRIIPAMAIIFCISLVFKLYLKWVNISAMKNAQHQALPGLQEQRVM